MHAPCVLVFLACINVQFCEAFYWWWYSPVTSTSTPVSGTAFSTPEECARECQDNEQPKCCYYHFTLEYYTSFNMACDFCEPLSNSSGISSSCECVPTDGFEKTILSLNRMIPGPSIQVCKNDTVIVDVENKAEGLETSIHWHGLFQNGYQYYDGVPLLTQCPITSGTTFRYQYKVQNSGTHFYHAHISVHMIDGEYGSLIVRDPPSTNPHSDKYDKDLHVIIISDSMHEMSMERFPGRYRKNRGQIPDNYLINGRGNWVNPQTGASTNISLATFMIKNGTRYRFRVINACSTVCLITLAIEKHPMELIATDGENVTPVWIDAAVMATGERLDFILHANQTPGQYWIHVRGEGECEPPQIYQLAVLIYDGTSESSLSSKPGYQFDNPPKTTFNPLNSTECEINVCVDKLCKIYDGNVSQVTLNESADSTFTLSFDFFNYSNQNLQNLFRSGSYNRFFIATDGSALDGLLGNISYEDPPGPLISQRNGYQQICSTPQTSPTCTDPCTCTHVFNIELDEIVDVMIYDRRPLSELNHPFHLHGHSFCVLYSGQFVNATDKGYITEEDVNREMEAHQNRLTNNSYKCCSPKDTVIVPNTGFVIFRFYTNNPGWWFFHCHFLWHTASGMNVAFHVGDDSDLPPVPSHFPQCYNWVPPPEESSCS